MFTVDYILSKYKNPNQQVSESTNIRYQSYHIEEDWGNLRSLPATWLKELKTKNLDSIGNNSDLVEIKSVSKPNEVTKFVRSIETSKDTPYIGAYLTSNDNPLMLLVYERRKGFYKIEPKDLEYAKNKDGSSKLDSDGNKVLKNFRFPLGVGNSAFFSNDELQAHLKNVLSANSNIKLFGVTVDTKRTELRELRMNKKTSLQGQKIKTVLTKAKDLLEIVINHSNSINTHCTSIRDSINFKVNKGETSVTDLEEVLDLMFALSKKIRALNTDYSDLISLRKDAKDKHLAQEESVGAISASVKMAPTNVYTLEYNPNGKIKVSLKNDKGVSIGLDSVMVISKLGRGQGPNNRGNLVKEFVLYPQEMADEYFDGVLSFDGDISNKKQLIEVLNIVTNLKWF